MSPFNNNYSNETELKVGSFNGGGNKARAFMHFDTSNLPAGITYAELQMREMHSYNCNNGPEKIHRVQNGGWVGSTLTSYPGAAIDSWSTPGGWQAGSGSCGNRLALWNVTGDVQGWRNSGTTNGSFAALAGNENDSHQWKKYRSYQAGDGPLLKIFSGNGPRTPSALQPPSMLPVKGPSLTLSARYDHPLGYPGQLAFGLWNGSGVMVWNQWSVWTSSGVQREITTSALPVNAWYELRVAAFDGTTYSDFTPPGHWIFNNTWAPETPTEITPTPNATVGQSFTASARYADHWGFAGELEFRFWNEASQYIGAVRSSQQVQYAQIGSVPINLSPGRYTMHAYSHSVGLFSAPSAGIPITVATAPGASTNVTATGMAEMAQVNWNAPNNGGSAVTAIKVTAQNQSGGPSKTVECQGSCLSSSTATIQQLVGGDSYKFIVEALNVMGTGPASTPSASTTTQSSSILTPSAVTATAVDGGADVTWTPPVLGGLLPLVTGYTVQTYRASDGAPIGSPQASATPSAQFRNLPNGTPVYFKVIATTAFIVVSPESLASNTVTPAGTPFGPTKVAVIPGDSQATIAWNPPDPQAGDVPGDNGSAVTGYSVERFATQDASGPPIESIFTSAEGRMVTIVGLENGISAFFKVRTINGVGSGSNSASSRTYEVLPAGVPFEPSIIDAIVLGPNEARVLWEPSLEGMNGARVTSHKILPFPACTSCSGLEVGGEDFTTVITGLAPSTEYSFKVVASNSVGEGSESLASEAITTEASVVLPLPLGELHAPLNVSAVMEHEVDSEGGVQSTATVSWAPPTGGPVSEYEIRTYPGSSSVLAPATATSALITGLNGKNITYRFVVIAKSSTQGSRTAYSIPIPSIKAVGDRLLNVALPEFTQVYNNERPAPFTWENYDGCSFPALDPKFTEMCFRHDFGYRNYGSGGDLELSPDGASRERIDYRLANDIIQYECGPFSLNPSTISCYAIASDVYVILRLAGGVAYND